MVQILYLKMPSVTCLNKNYLWSPFPPFLCHVITAMCQLTPHSLPSLLVPSPAGGGTAPDLRHFVHIHRMGPPRVPANTRPPSSSALTYTRGPVSLGSLCYWPVTHHINLCLNSHICRSLIQNSHICRSLFWFFCCISLSQKYYSLLLTYHEIWLSETQYKHPWCVVTLFSSSVWETPYYNTMDIYGP